MQKQDIQKKMAKEDLGTSEEMRVLPDDEPDLYSDEESEKHRKLFAGIDTENAQTQRNVVCSSDFIKDYDKLPCELKNRVDDIKNNLCYLTENEYREFLNSKNCKKMNGLFKFRLTYGARISFQYLRKEGAQYPAGSICLDRIIVQHDEQNRLIKKRKSSLQTAKPLENGILDAAPIDESKGMLVYDSRTFLPLLSEEQKEYTYKSLPVIINGSAGSGKTCIAVQIYKKYVIEHSEDRVAYITMSRALADRVYDDLIKERVSYPQCLTYKELCGGAKKGWKMVSDDTFSDFFKKYIKFNSSYQWVSRDLFEMCFNSIYKGCVDVDAVGKGSTSVSYERFEKLAQKEGITENIDGLYSLAKKYQEYLTKNEYYDGNDLAQNLIASKKEFDCIIIDEAQDFTDLQIQSIIRCCPSGRFVLLGDKNQVIRASTFDFGIFRKEIREKQGIEKCEKFTLKNTYRCGKALIEYINRLTELRKEKIAKQDQEDDQPEVSMRGDNNGMYAILVTEADVIREFLQKAADASNCWIIVDNTAVKEKLQRELGSESKDGLEYLSNIVTVEESKGLDYQVVVLYGFIEENRKYFLDIQAGRAKKSTIHRIVFNKYYVACTRAEDRIIICEQKEYVEELRNGLFEDLLENNDVELLEYYLETSPESWLMAAKTYYEEKNYAVVDRYLRKYDTYPDAEHPDEYGKLLERNKKHMKAEQTTDEKVLRECAEFFEKCEPESALRIYQKIKDEYKIFILQLQLQLYSSITVASLKETLSKYSIRQEDIETVINSRIISKLLSKTNKALANG